MTQVPADTQEGRARAALADYNAGNGDAPTVRIGIVTPLTGPGDAMAGELIVRGAVLGAEWLRERGGLPDGTQVELVVENDQATAAVEGMQRSSVGAVAKLVVMDGVVALIGQWHLRTTPFVAETAERLGVPIIVETGHSGITARGYRHVFRTYFTIADRVPMMVDFMADQGMRRIAVLAADTVFGLMTADTIEEVVKERGAGIEVLRFDVDQESTTSVRPELEAVRDFGPDLIVNSGVVRTNYLIINEAAELGLRPAVPMMVAFPFPMRSEDYWRLAGPAGNLVIWPSTTYRPSTDGLTGIGRWFTERYAARHGSFPPDNALNAFTDVTILAQALSRTGGRTRADLLEQLETGEFDTWRGPVRFGAADGHLHHSPPEIVLMQYQQVGQNVDEAAVIWPPERCDAPYVPPS